MSPDKIKTLAVQLIFIIAQAIELQVTIKSRMHENFD